MSRYRNTSDDWQRNVNLEWAERRFGSPVPLTDKFGHYHGWRHRPASGHYQLILTCRIYVLHQLIWESVEQRLVTSAESSR